MSVSHRVLSRTGRSVRRAGSSAPTPARWAPLGLRLSALRPNKPPAGEPAPGMAGQLPGSPSLLLARDHQGQREASPINTFNWGCFLVTHLPAFLQQTSLNSCAHPTPRSRRDVLAGRGPGGGVGWAAGRWFQGGCPARAAQGDLRRRRRFRTSVYRLLLLRKLLSVKVILAQMSNKYAPS